MPKTINLFVTTLTLLVTSHVIYGQQKDTSNLIIKEVEIGENYTNRHFDRQVDMKDNVIYAGKKNEILLIDRIDANKAQNNPRQILGRVPGMNFSETEGSGFPSNGFGLRGLNPTQSVEMNTRQNGYNISADIFGYNESYYNPSLESVEKIEVIRGASSLQYGPQFGGVVNFIMKQAPINKPFELTSYQTIGSFGLFSSSNTIAGTIKKWSYVGSFQYKSQQGWRPNSDYNSFTGFAKVEYKFNSKLKAGLEYSILRNRIHMPGGLTDAQFEANPKGSFRARNWLTTPWNILAATFDYAINSTTNISFKSALQSSCRDLVWKNESGGPGEMDSISPVTNAYVQREVGRQQFKNITNELRFSKVYSKSQHVFAGGVRYYQGQLIRNGGGPGSTASDFDLNLYGGGYEYSFTFTTTNVALFAENIFRVSKNWTIIPGMRYETIKSKATGYQDEGGTMLYANEHRLRKFLLLGVGTQYTLFRNTNLYANYSEAYKPMDYSSLTPIGVSSKIDPNLKDASGYNMDFGWRGTVGKFLNFDVGGFYMFYKNRVGLLTLTDNNGNPYTFRTNTGNSVTKGLETYIEFNPIKMYTDFSKFGYISIFNSLALIDARYVSGEDENGTSLKNNMVEYSPSYIHRVGITYGYKKFSTTFVFSNTGKSYGDAENTVRSSDAIVGVIPAYKVMDLAVTYKLSLLNIKAGINNLADVKYFTKRADEYPGPGIIPAIGRSFYLGFGVKF